MYFAMSVTAAQAVCRNFALWIGQGGRLVQEVFGNSSKAGDAGKIPEAPSGRSSELAEEEADRYPQARRLPKCNIARALTELTARTMAMSRGSRSDERAGRRVAE